MIRVLEMMAGGMQMSGMLAQNQPAGDSKPGWMGLLESPLTLIVVMIIVMYFFVIRSKQKQEKQRQNMLNELKRGDRIQTIGGILGTVVEAKETEVVVKTDETTNTKMRFVRSAIHRVIEEDKKS